MFPSAEKLFAYWFVFLLGEATWNEKPKSHYQKYYSRLVHGS